MAPDTPGGSHLKARVGGGTPPQMANLVRNVSEGIVVVDSDGVVLFANPAAETLLRRAPGDAFGFNLGYPLAGDEPTIITLRPPGTDAAIIEMRAAETPWDDGTAFVVNLHDITERTRGDAEQRQLQKRTDRLNQVLRAIASVAQVIIRESDPGRLIRATCERLVEDGGFRAAWLVLTNEDGSLVDTAQSPLADGPFPTVTDAFARGVVPECCRRAKREGRVVRFEPARDCEATLCAGLAPTEHALVACLTHGTRTFGYITVVFDSPEHEDGEAERLLHTVAIDLGFALHSDEQALAREKTQRLLEETERVADVGGWEWDLTTDRFTVSPEWRRIHGWGEGAIEFSDVLSLCLPADQERWAAGLESLRRGHATLELEHRIIKRDNGETRVLCSRSGSVEERANGQRVVRGIAQDITAAHQATERIRFQARLLASVGEAIIVNDPKGRILYWNQAAQRLYGWPAEAVLGRNVVDVIREPGAEVPERLAAGENWSGELMMRARDGRRFPALVTTAPVIGEDGKLDAVIGVVSDLSERTRAANELLETSRKLAAAVVAGHVGLWQWNLETEEVTFSAEWKRQIGYAEDEIKDDFEEWRSRVHPEDLDQALERIRIFIAGGQEELRLEFRFRHKNGSYRSILAQADVIEGEEGRPVRLMVGAHVDITDLREAEAHQQNIEAQLQQAQKMESVGRLAGGVAHDFNNVLAVILGISEISLGNIEPSDPLRADFQEIHQAATRAAALTRQLLAFARKQTIDPRVIDLNETVGGMVKMLSRLVGEDVELVWKPAYQLWPVKVDPAQVDQILANLTVNARDAIQEGDEGNGRISLQTANIEVDQAFCDHNAGLRPGQYVVLSVSDNGVGMANATVARAFEPFFTTKATGTGTGLGLATVYGIVKQNAGSVYIYSVVGEGTTIRIYLPRLVGAEAEGGTLGEALELVQGTETLLVVEDDAPVRRVMSRILERLGYTLLLAETGEEALDLFRERGETIDLLMTDVVMPGMNGRDLVEAVRALRPGVQCLFISGYTHDVISNRGVLGAGVHFLEKPFTTEGLASTVRRVLDERGAGQVQRRPPGRGQE